MLQNDTARNRAFPILLGIAYGIALRLILAIDSHLFSSGLLSISFFVLVPVAIGFVVVYADTKAKDRRFYARIFSPWIAIIAFLLTTVVLMLEGSICVLIVLPGFLLLSSIGGLLAGWIRSREKVSSSALSVVLLMPIVLSPLEARFPIAPDVKTRTDRIVIDASAATIWQNLANVERIDESELAIGITRLLGVPRPIEARMVRSDADLARHTKWDKGISFQERITFWREHQSMQWQFEFPPGSVPAGTLDDHVAIGGEFFDLIGGGYTLVPMENGNIELVLTTTYRVSARPKFYSLIWADLVMGDFHRMILGVVANRSESSAG